ncbi:MAG: PKD domain-containing protein [Bacteroidia bacterium]
MFNRNCNFNVFVLLLAFFLSAGSVSASHSQGADLTYECLGGNQYRVTLSFYRDCAGVAAPNAAIITVSSASCGQNFTINLNPLPGTGQEVSPICQTATTECSGGVLPGVQEYIYTNTVMLPANCSDWVFSYDLCCRNTATNTIFDPGNQNIRVEATLDNLNVTCNSSPAFSNNPVPFICVGQTFCFNHGAIDADGDSLVYSLVAPLNASGSSVAYLGGYSATQPLNSNPAVTFDNATGDICMTPQALEVAVVAVLVEEYRNGQLIGSVMRDLQIRVVNCTNDLPSIDGIDLSGAGTGSGNYTISTCANTNLCFFINSFDADVAQNLSLSWNNAIPAASFNPGNGQRPQAQFCWTPTQADISNIPHCFTVQVKDDNCQYYGTSVYSFCITVEGITVDLGADQNISCVNQTALNATVTGGNGNYTYLWNTGETSASINAAEGTWYVDVVDVLNGCTGSDTVVITYINNPVADFTFNTACEGTATNFTDASQSGGGTNITSWNWDFGDGNTSIAQNPAHTYNASGTFTVRLVAENNIGCRDTILQDVTVNPAPQVDFSFTDECAGTVVNFTDQTAFPSGSITDWTWNFGDGSPVDNTQNTTHSFTNAGQYSVTLVATGDNNCTTIFSQTVEAFPIPVPDFSYSNACMNSALQFTDQSTIAAGTINSWSWDFGDGSPVSAQQNPVHSYSATGSFNAALSVVSDNGCPGSLSQNITVRDLPLPAFSNTTACEQSPADFTDNSTIANGSIVAWDWTFGDISSNSNEQNPVHIYSADGNFDVKLVLTSDFGCMDSLTQTITVYPVPDVAFTATNSCLGDTSVFSDLSTITSGSITSWTWSFGNGNFSSAQDTVYAYPVAASYLVGLQVVSDRGCTATETTVLLVDDIPQAAFTINDICQNDNALFTDQSFITTGSLAQWDWDFGDGSPVFSGSNPPAHSYGSMGLYSVSLIVTSVGGCSDTAFNNIAVYPIPEPDFTATTACYGTATAFTDLSGIAFGSVESWTYDFNDNGVITNNSNPLYTFSTQGVFDVTLTVASDFGCEADTTYSVIVNAVPEVNFSATAVCLGTATAFTDLSAIPFGSNIAWDWNFNDGATSTLQNSFHTYANAGIFNVNLTVTSDSGCVADTILPVEVFPAPDVDFTSDIVEGCQPLAVNFTDLSIIAPGYNIVWWLWDFGDSNSSSAQNPLYVFDSAGVFSVILHVKSGNGCDNSDTIAGMITVHPKPVANFSVSPQPTTIIYPHIDFTDNSSGANQWQYDFGDNTNAALQNPQHSYSDTGTYIVQQIVTNPFGCKDTIQRIVNIDAAFTFYIPNSFTPNADGDNDYFFGTGIGISAYEMRIFNRWGEQVFAAFDENEKWNGVITKTNQLAAQDVYVYAFRITDVFGTSHTYRGKVTVLAGSR